MDVFTTSIPVKTKGNADMLDVGDGARRALRESGMTEGQATFFVSGSTAALTTIEYEPGLQQDYPGFFEKVAPSSETYKHNQTWHDGNGHSHVRASLQGPSLVVPFANGDFLLGTWQQIILLDFDTRPRSRDVVAQFIGK
jgi:secondary thiamine-phosphate synthase enzyme